MHTTVLSTFTVKYNIEVGVVFRGESARGGEQATRHAGDKKSNLVLKPITNFIQCPNDFWVFPILNLK